MRSAVDRACAPSHYDVERVRRDFPVLETEVRGHPLVYLDNAASAPKPRAVIEAVSDLYSRYYANVHRGVHHLSELSTEAYERARRRVARFLGGERAEIVFTSGTTEAVNLVAQSYARPRLRPGDEVLITHLEHHSNIVPWQLVCEQTGARLVVAPIDEQGEVILDAFANLLGERTQMVAVGHVSNALGTINPVIEMVELARQHGATVLLDGAQAVPHLEVDVQQLGCDFYAFSGHKIYGPTGIGALWARRGLLEDMPPYKGGGEMIRSVRFDKTEYADVPHRFEAGTPNIAGAVGLGAALDYLSDLGLAKIGAHENQLLAYATEALQELSGVRLIGTARKKVSVVSFVVEGIHPHDVGTILDGRGIAIRTGHHCAQPVMERFGLPATARASFGLYNTRQEVDALATGIRHAQELFA